MLRPSGTNASAAEIALCPAQRSAMVYLLHQARGGALARVVATAREIEGVDLVMWWRGGRAHIAGERGELSFVPGDDVTDERGLRWDVDGELDALLATVEEGLSSASTTPTRCGACGRR